MPPAQLPPPRGANVHVRQGDIADVVLKAPHGPVLVVAVRVAVGPINPALERHVIVPRQFSRGGFPQHGKDLDLVGQDPALPFLVRFAHLVGIQHGGRRRIHRQRVMGAAGKPLGVEVDAPRVSLLVIEKMRLLAVELGLATEHPGRTYAVVEQPVGQGRRAGLLRADEQNVGEARSAGARRLSKMPRAGNINTREAKVSVVPVNTC